MARMDPFTTAYFEAALWSTNDNSGNSHGDSLDVNYSINDIDEATTAKMIADCADFQKRFGDLIDEDDSADIQKFGARELAGYDFWMTRNGHGVGFWEDSDWPKHGEELDAGAKEYGEFYLEVGDDGEIYGSPLDSPSTTRESRRGVVRSPQHVADFNTLHDLINHAHRELGATHVSGEDAHTKIYFPRGGRHPYEEATVWRKGSYWHAQGPGARTGVEHLPRDAKPIGGARRAAEGRTVASNAFLTRRPSQPGWYLQYSDGTFIGPYPRGEEWVRREAEALSLPEHPVTAVQVVTPSRRGRRAAERVQDYAVVDRRDRTIAGPFKSYSDARSAAGGAGAVKFVPSKTREVHTDKTTNRFSRDRFGGGEQGEALAHKALLKHEASLVPGATVRVYRGNPAGMIGTIESGKIVNGRSVAVIDADDLRWTIETRNLEIYSAPETRETRENHRRSAHHRINPKKPR